MAVLLASTQAAAAAPTEPLLEAGGLVAGGWFPDYPAAGQNHWHVLPLPFILYRGDILRSDERGLRGQLYRGDRAELDISLGGALPTSSDDNDAREGMNDLDLMGEIGPSLRLGLARDPGRSRLDLELPLRAVFTTDFEAVTYRGLVFAPELAWQRADLLRDGSRLRIGIGPIFGTDRYMDYFYDVEPRFQRPGRDEHEADPGYLGARLQGSYRAPVNERLSLFGGGRIDGFWGATNDGSPLYKEDVNLSLIAGLSYSLYQSIARVPAHDDGFD